MKRRVNCLNKSSNIQSKRMSVFFFIMSLNQEQCKNAGEGALDGSARLAVALNRESYSKK